MKNIQLTEEIILKRNMGILRANGVDSEEGLLGSISFSTGVDKWLLFVNNVSDEEKTCNITLLHKDNVFMSGKKHKLYKGIPGYHIQKVALNTKDHIVGVKIALSHQKKWKGNENICAIAENAAM